MRNERKMMKEKLLEKETEKDKAGKKSSNFKRASVVLVFTLLILTFLSKSLYNYRLPAVTVTRPKEGRFVYRVEGISELTYAGTDPVYAERDGRIREILVAAGEQVRAGQCLMRLESGDTGELFDVTAACDGVITWIGIKEGMYVSATQNTVLYEIAKKPEEWVCFLIISDEQAEHISMESVPVISMTGRNEKAEGEILSIVAYAGQNQEGYKVTVAVKNADAFAGEKVSIAVEEESALYDTLIPAAALCKDPAGYYVLVLRENNSVLGEGYSARRISVDFLDSDEVYCAVRGLPSDEYVIVTATDEIGDGSNVFYEGAGMR